MVEYPSFTLGPISLDIEGITGLVGPNGAGKTTLLRALAGQLPHARGQVAKDGQVLDDLARRKSLALCISPESLYRNLSFAQHLQFLRGFYANWSMEIEIDLIKRFNIPLSKVVGAASAGTIIKFSLLVAFARRAEGILFDEPWNSLDPTVRFEFSDELVRLRLETGSDVLISSHDLSLLEAIAPSVSFLACGKIIRAKRVGEVGRVRVTNTLEQEYRDVFL